MISAFGRCLDINKSSLLNYHYNKSNNGHLFSFKFDVMKERDNKVFQATNSKQIRTFFSFQLRKKNLETNNGIISSFLRKENNADKRKTKNDFFKPKDEIKKENEDEEEILFLIDKRRWFVNVAILAFVQLFFAIIAANVFFNFAQIRIEKEEKDKKEEELELLKTISTSEKLKERPENDQLLVKHRIAILEQEIEDFSKAKSHFGFFTLLKKFEAGDFVKVMTPLAFSAVVFFVIRTLGYYAVRQVDLLPGGKQVRIGTYRFFGHPQHEIIDITKIIQSSSNDKFVFIRLPHLKLFNATVNIKEGTIFNAEKLYKVLKGVEPKSQLSFTDGTKPVADVVNKFLKK